MLLVVFALIIYCYGLVSFSKTFEKNNVILEEKKKTKRSNNEKVRVRLYSVHSNIYE